jgi:hypothetical protein
MIPNLLLQHNRSAASSLLFNYKRFSSCCHNLPCHAVLYHSLLLISSPSLVPPPLQLVKINSSNVVADFTERQAKLDRMVASTGQAVDVCHFYLEMVDWDFDSAVQMFGSFATES